VTPGATAISNIGYKYFIIFACLTLVSVAVIYFMYPETKGKSLEELAELFGDPVVVHLTDATEEEKLEMDREIKRGMNVEHVEKVEKVET
jgi:cbb3-type cytochrome oxidase subunit 3